MALMGRRVGRLARAEYVEALLLPLLAVASLRLWHPAFGWVARSQGRYALIDGTHGVLHFTEAHAGAVLPRAVLVLDLAAFALVAAALIVTAARRVLTVS